MYILNDIVLEWNDIKNTINVRTHGVDFHDAPQVFEHPILKKIDRRKDYGEERWIALGTLNEAVIVMVYTMRKHKIRIISMRRANRNERKIYHERFKKPN